jgi:hypothetical protein
MAIERTFRRMTGDPKNWWHWRPECQIYKAAPMQKKRGQTFVYLVLTDGSRPTTFNLCPGCVALDERIRTKDHPYLTKKVVPVRPTSLAPNANPNANPVNTIVPRYYYTGAFV